MTSTSLSQTSKHSQRPATLGLLLALAAGSLLAVSNESASAESSTSPAGTLSANSGRLPARNRCGTYSYSYSMTPPPGNWALETFVSDPRGENVASGAILGGYTPGGDAGSDSYQLCRNNTRPGAFTLRGTFTVDDGTGEVTTTEMNPVTFTLAKAPRHRGRHQRSH